MKQRIIAYILRHWDELLTIDLSLARLIGAPAPHTLSSWAYKRSRFWTVVIDATWKWLFRESNHCKTESEKIK